MAQTHANEAWGVRVTGPVLGAPRGRSLPGSRGAGKSQAAHRRRGHGWPRSMVASPPNGRRVPRHSLQVFCADRMLAREAEAPRALRLAPR